MMAISKVQPLTNVRESLHHLISAHEAVLQGIATHAEKQRAKHQAMRHAAEQRAKMAEGAVRQNAHIRAAS